MIRRAMLKTCVPSMSRRMWRRTMAGQNRQAADKLDRCPHDKARELWHVAEAPQNDRMHLWLGQAAWHDAQGEASRGCSYRRRILAEPHRLQPDPHPEIGCRIGELRKDTRKSLLCRAKRLNHQHKAPYRNGKTSNFPVFPQTASGQNWTAPASGGAYW